MYFYSLLMYTDNQMVPWLFSRQRDRLKKKISLKCKQNKIISCKSYVEFNVSVLQIAISGHQKLLEKNGRRHKIQMYKVFHVIVSTAKL